MSGLDSLPKDKWNSGDKQPILLADFIDLEAALIQMSGVLTAPNLAWVDATQVKAPASQSSPAKAMLCGFPNILHPGQFVDGGLSDGKYRVNTTPASVDFDLAATFWGSEISSFWYAVYALAGDADAVFSLKAMPLVRVKEDAGQVVTLAKHVLPSQPQDVGFTANELAGYQLYVLSGAQAGELRAVTANASGTLTYGGANLALSQGDWAALLPATNFRLLGFIFNNNSGNIDKFTQVGRTVLWSPSAKSVGTEVAAIGAAPPVLVKSFYTHSALDSGSDTYYQLRLTFGRPGYGAGYTCLGYELQF